MRGSRVPQLCRAHGLQRGPEVPWLWGDELQALWNNDPTHTHSMSSQTPKAANLGASMTVPTLRVEKNKSGQTLLAGS